MDPLAIPLPIAAKRRGEIIGIVAGAISFPVALYAGSLAEILPRGPVGVVLPIVLLSGLAGAVASIVADRIDSGEVPGVPLRVGARTGFVASMIGGAATVLAWTLHSFGLGVPTSLEVGLTFLNLFRRGSSAGFVILLCIIALPPSTFFGLIGALLAGLIADKGSAAGVGYSDQQRPPARQKSPIFLGALVLTVLCYLSPLIVAFKPTPKPPPVSTLVPAPPRRASPLPPKWRYAKPEGFEDLEPARLKVLERRTLGRIAQNLPIAISPDGHRLAYCVSGQSTQIQVSDLNTLDVVASAQAAEPAELAWSPDSKMLLLVNEGDDRTLRVLSVEDSKLMTLPQPRDRRVPQGRPRWWDVQEVLFSSPTTDNEVLDLDMLRVRPAEVSQKWKALGDVVRKEIKKGVASHLPSTARWSIGVRSAVRRYEIPVDSVAPWIVNESTQMTLVDAQNAYHLPLSEADIRPGDSVVGSFDGTKFVRIRDNETSVYYLGSRAGTSNRFVTSMPADADATVAEGISKGRVAAFVCGPLVNPLNQKTVGPDRNNVKALVRIASWTDKTAAFWVDEEGAEIQAGDVVADLHTWERRQPLPVGDLVKSEWFSVIDKVESGPTPTKIEAPPLDRSLLMAVEQRRGVDRIERFLPPDESAPNTPVPVAKPAENQPADPSDDLEVNLRVFLVNHHERSSKVDISGFAADYADRVTYLNHGVVNNEFIRKDKASYLSPGTRVTETLVAKPTIDSLPDGTVKAEYTISFFRQLADGKWLKGLGDISLRVRPEGQSFRIVEQHIKIRNKQQSP